MEQGPTVDLEYVWGAGSTQHDESTSWSDAVLGHVARNVAAYDGPVYLDYTVLGVAVITLSFLLVAEYLRHILDHSSEGRPFVKTVLDAVYRELTTLGLVEFCVFMAHAYHPNFNLKEEKIFAKVHFTFFITAITNAIMTVLLAIVSSAISHRMWVETEEIQVRNYIAIRAEFEEVEKELLQLNNRPKSWCSVFTRCYQVCQKPRLKWKYRSLLVQVRFHELRVHFLHANELSHRFKVSEYLKKSEVHVFKKLAHISSFAWISLMGAVNLLYYALGMVASTSENQRTVGTTMEYIFFGYQVCFVLTSLAILKKVKGIFSRIINMKLVAKKSDVNDQTYWNGSQEVMDAGDAMIEFGSRRHARGDEIRQLDLFWGGDPQLIIGALQFMQFGYAIAAAILVIFWDKINVDYGSFTGVFYIFALVLCYFAFLVIMANVVPIYTLCTNLGQLVNRRRMNEVLAKLKLEEALKKRQAMLDQMDAQETAQFEMRKLSARQLSTGGTGQKSAANTGTGAFSDTLNEGDSLRQKQLLELVQTKTEDLPQLEPETNQSDLRKERRRRMKAMSDGVSSMRLFGTSGTSGAGASQLNISGNSGTTEQNKPRRKKTLSAESSNGKINREPPRRKKSLSANAALSRSPTSSFFEGVDSNEEKVEEDAVITTVHNSSSSTATLEQLIEDIPARNVHAAELSVPMGRNGHKEEDFRIDVQASTDAMKEDISMPKETDSGRISNVRKGYDAEVDTVDTADSDIPKLRDNVDRTNASTSPLGDTLRKFFTSRQYRIIDTVFGTLVCFFFVGMRVEVLLIGSGVMPDLGNTWDFRIYRTFWCEVSWLIMFILKAIFKAFLFRPQKVGKKMSEKVLLSASLTFGLSAACLLILLWAEAERCCPSGGDCCERFGERTYGGLGNIEPFTSLIMLRAFRWWFTKRVMIFRGWLKGKKKEQKRPSVFTESTAISSHVKSMSQDSEGSLSYRPTDFDTSHGDHHPIDHFEEESGTIIELWRVAIAMYPDVVEKHGEFSGELLQAMLGILGNKDHHDIDVHMPLSTRKRVEYGQNGTLLLQSDPASRKTQTEVQSAQKKPTLEHSTGHALELSSQYNDLDESVQRVILAGRVGRPVCLRNTTSETPRSESNGQATVSTTRIAPDNGESFAVVPDKSTRDRRVAPAAPLEFVFDTKREQEETQYDVEEDLMPHDGLESHFSYPNARLIRSMRRCERRLPPILDKWAVVDVVLTKYELVYFDASDVDDVDGSVPVDGESELLATRRSVRRAIIATKGGKGLRLRDVAAGRKVVGHLELSAVDQIHIERKLPIHAAALDDGRKEPHGTLENETTKADVVKKDEYWEPGATTTLSDTAAARLPRRVRWEHVNEDRLKIHSLQGTLYLRFFSDLEEAETNKGTLYPHDAFIWCRTIARLCGAEQLKQPLPHLGDNEGTLELVDFLEVVGHNNHLLATPRKMLEHARHRTIDTHDVDKSGTQERKGSGVFFGDADMV